MTPTELRRLRLRPLLALFTAAIVTPTAYVSAQPAPEATARRLHETAATLQTSAPMVLLKLVSIGTRTGMSTGAPGASFGGRRLAAGESVTGALIAGSPGNADLAAQWGSMGGPVNADEQGALHLWRATMQATKINGDEITLVVDWQRFDAIGGRHEARAGDRRMITLKDGERHTLDFVSSAAAGPGECASVLVQVEASLVDDPALANTRLGYDLWLVDQEPAGQQVTRHMEIAGKQRESVNFRFLPIGWSSDGSPVAADGHPEILVEVSGTIKGWLQPDGSLQIAVTPSRRVRVGNESGTSGYREKILTAKPGETIRMDIPPSGPTAVRSHRTSLSLTVRPW